jgi:hypothetical protein
MGNHQHKWEPTDTEGHTLECVECGEHVYQGPAPDAGSRQAVLTKLSDTVYEFFQLLDEIGHAVGLDNFEWYYRFCDWSHRKDAE